MTDKLLHSAVVFFTTILATGQGGLAPGLHPGSATEKQKKKRFFFILRLNS